jgi:hypothetical protein
LPTLHLNPNPFASDGFGSFEFACKGQPSLTLAFYEKTITYKQQNE